MHFVTMKFIEVQKAKLRCAINPVRRIKYIECIKIWSPRSKRIGGLNS